MYGKMNKGYLEYAKDVYEYSISYEAEAIEK